MDLDKMQIEYSITILNAIKNKKFNCSDGLQFRDFVHIDDVTDAIIKTLRTE